MLLVWRKFSTLHFDEFFECKYRTPFKIFLGRIYRYGSMMQKNKVTVLLFADPYGHYSRPLASTASNQQPPLQPRKKKNGVDSDQCYSSVYVPNPNHHLIESSFSSSSTNTRGGLSGLSGHSSSGQDSTCIRGQRPGKTSTSCSSSEDNSLCRLNGNYTKETNSNWTTGQNMLNFDPIVVQQEVN